MSDIQIFEHEDFGEIRAKVVDGEPNWVVKDVCSILGLSSVAKSLKRVKNRWVNKIQVPHPQSDTKMMKVNAVNEPGLYKLVFRSNKPFADEFSDWVAEEVLPQIRKTGSYSIEDEFSPPETYPEALRELAATEEEKQRLKAENQKKEQIIGELKPKADYTDKILQSDSLVTITQIAKDYGMSGQAMNKKLHELGVQYKQGDQWLLYSEHQGKGYTHSETIEIDKGNGGSFTKMYTKWTQKGRLFLYNLLKEHGTLPTIEQQTEAPADIRAVK